jgi:hypothetical protein
MKFFSFKRFYHLGCCKDQGAILWGWEIELFWGKLKFSRYPERKHCGAPFHDNYRNGITRL